MDMKNEEFRLVLLGKTGNGKSSTGNSLMGLTMEDENRFQTKFGTSLTTIKCQTKVRQVLGKQLVLLDTPGFLNTILSMEDTRDEIEKKVIGITSPGPHAFLLILRCDVRYTQEDEKVISEIKKIFGKSFLDYTVIIFTRSDELEKNRVSEDEMIRSSSRQLKDLLKKCNNRWICINNFATDDHLQEKVSNVMDIVTAMRSENKPDYYCNRKFRKYLNWLRKKVKQKERESLQGTSIIDRTGELLAMRNKCREDVERENQEVMQVLSDITSCCNCCIIL